MFLIVDMWYSVLLAYIIRIVSVSRFVYIFLLAHRLSLLCQRYAVDSSFFMAKELLMTERTYKKDLQVIAVVSKGPVRIFF